MLDATSQPLSSPDELTAQHLVDLEETIGMNIDDLLALDKEHEAELLAGMSRDPAEFTGALTMMLNRLKDIPVSGGGADPRCNFTPDHLEELGPAPFITPGLVRVVVKKWAEKESPLALTALLDRYESMLEKHTRPVLPLAWRPVMAAALLSNGGNAADVAKMERRLFTPWLSREAFTRLRAEIDAHRVAPRGPAEPTKTAGSVDRFLMEACIREAGAMTRPADLVAHYLKWAKASGLRPVGKQAFYRELAACAPEIRRVRPKSPQGKQSTVMFLSGIRILNH
jgi:hypothetical protein